MIDSPNILLILTDQQRFDTIAARVNHFGAKTPALDSLVKRGVVFANAFCTSPVSCPSRATIVTGLYPTQAGVPDNTSPPLSENLTTIGHRMQAAGYETVYHGKSHLKGDLGLYGFEIAFENSHDHTTCMEASRYWRNKDWITSKRPFFHVVSFLDPHDIYFIEPDGERPVALPAWPNADDTLEGKPACQQDKRRDWSPQRWEYYRQFYAERVERVDREMHELLQELTCSGFASNTWILFTSDHGDMAGEHGIAFKGPYLYDGVVRIPLIIVPPRTDILGSVTQRVDVTPPDFRPFVSSTLASNIDLVPTLMDMAGVAPDPDLPGHSLLPVVLGQDAAERAAVFAEWQEPRMRMVRTHAWKYCVYEGQGEELYDLEADPAEVTNLAGQAHVADKQRELHAQLKAHCERISDPFAEIL